MKVTSIQFISSTPDSTDTIEFSFRDPRRLQPYNVRAMVGLDADEIVPKFYLGSNNSKFYEMSLPKKEIVVRIELNPNPATGESYSDLRDALYKKIAAWRSGTVMFVFKNGNTNVAFIQGHVTKFEAAHFSETPEVQITVLCRYPYLLAYDRTNLDVSGLNEASTVIIDNESTAPHGMAFKLNVLATRSQFKIFEPTNLDWSLTAVPFGGFLAGDEIYLSSEAENKYFYMVRAGITYPLASVISAGSVFPMIFPGENTYAIENPTSFSWAEISYYRTYWGV